MVTGKKPFSPQTIKKTHQISSILTLSLPAKTISPHHKPARCNVGARKMAFFSKIYQKTYTAISISYLFRRKSFKMMYRTLKKNPGFISERAGFMKIPEGPEGS
jgi:hypothetical protein